MFESKYFKLGRKVASQKVSSLQRKFFMQWKDIVIRTGASCQTRTRK